MPAPSTRAQQQPPCPMNLWSMQPGYLRINDYTKNGYRFCTSITQFLFPLWGIDDQRQIEINRRRCHLDNRRVRV